MKIIGFIFNTISNVHRKTDQQEMFGRKQYI